MIYNGVRGVIRASSKVGKLHNLSPPANPLEYKREQEERRWWGSSSERHY
jgi:hypothetical protein